uniref:Uncharacterized protein n=1 Tax=Myoviridae sp. ct4uh47 TaxID=2825032 RepID=A0A8S5V5V0_9CAUD|nr:MAG TPA: hypothetical protein [Myoviridae sp. ct4uh47]
MTVSESQTLQNSLSFSRSIRETTIYIKIPRVTSTSRIDTSDFNVIKCTAPNGFHGLTPKNLN